MSPAACPFELAVESCEGGGRNSKGENAAVPLTTPRLTSITHLKPAIAATASRTTDEDPGGGGHTNMEDQATEQLMVYYEVACCLYFTKLRNRKAICCKGARRECLANSRKKQSVEF